MRLITYERGGARRLGAWVGETVVDLPEAVGHPAFPPTMEALVQHIGGSILDAAHDILANEEVVAECSVGRPSVLPPLVPPAGPIRVLRDGGRIGRLQGRSYGAGLACVVGRASRTRRADLPQSMIFGYTLIIRWPTEANGASATRLGPCVLTPDELDERDLRLRLTIDGMRVGEKTVDAPQDLFVPAIATLTSNERLEAGDVIASLCWRFGARTTLTTRTPRVIELSAEDIGVLRTELPK